MLKFENNNLQQYISPFDVYIRYIDDTFMVCNDTTSMDDLSASFNEVHNVISFTRETEFNGKLAFMDVSISKNLNVSLFFRKSKWVGQYTHFHSLFAI